jgi:hypothetical protein
MRGLAMRFNGILRSRSSEALDEWIDDAIDTELTAIMRFASVLRRDIDAVKKCNRTPLEQRSSGRADQPPQDAETSNVRSRRPRTDEGENAAAESQKLRMNRLFTQTTPKPDVLKSIPL